MPRAPRLCSCGLLVAPGETCLCQRHRAAQRADTRPPASARGYDAEWRRRTAGFLRLHPHCAACARAGVVTPSEVVGHIVSVRIDPSRRLDPSNWEALCRSHNARDAHRDRKGGGASKTFEVAPKTTSASLARDFSSFSSPTRDKSEEPWPWD